MSAEISCSIVVGAGLVAVGGALGVVVGAGLLSVGAERDEQAARTASVAMVRTWRFYQSSARSTGPNWVRNYDIGVTRRGAFRGDGGPNCRWALAVCCGTVIETVRAMRGACAAAVLMLSAQLASADPPGASRRLEAVHLGWLHPLAEEKAGNSAMLTIEAGKRFASHLGVAGVVRYAKYAYGKSESDHDRHDIVVGPRIYVEPVPDRLLLGLGAGVLISFGDPIDGGPQGQPVVEAYAGVLLVRLGSDDLEIGVLGGLAVEEDLGWLGVSFGLRRRTW